MHEMDGLGYGGFFGRRCERRSGACVLKVSVWGLACFWYLVAEGKSLYSGLLGLPGVFWEGDRRGG